MDHRLRILHISDLHSREDGQEWRRRRVLGDAWKANLDAFLEEGAVAVIAFTGDLAFSGRPGEYEGVTGFIFATLEWLKLGRERLFVVPGNHDVDRSVARHAWSELRQFSPSDTYILSTWMASDGQWAPKHCAPSLREEVLTRQQAYRTWVRETLGRPELLPSPALHPRLGYRQTLRLPGHPFDLHVIGFDSAWLSGDEHDTGRLWLTEEQLVRLSSGAGGEPLEGFRLALIHHPLGDLRE
ncbi:MAG TPA: metallophosphoesterase, partial [Archangium sp.]|nr:metallophosphoesterase [Archangium sp.]